MVLGRSLGLNGVAFRVCYVRMSWIFMLVRMMNGKYCPTRMLWKHALPQLCHTVKC